MARTRRRLNAAPATEAPAPSSADAVAEPTAPILEKAQRLQRELIGARALAHEAQAREALTRTELTIALHATLAVRAELLAQARDRAVALHNALRPPT
jgi:hypothetical protein